MSLLLQPSAIIRSATTALIASLLLFLSWLPATVAAQSDKTTFFFVKGRVFDGASQAPVKGATVTVSAQSGAVKTDTSGIFKIATPPGEYVFTVNCVGYRATSQLFKVTQNMEINISMEAYQNQLEEVVVTSRQGRAGIETPSLGVSVLSLKSVKKLPAAAGEVDILRSLQSLPGVSSVGEGANGVNIRGSNVDQNLIYFEDMPIVNPTHMFGFFSVLATDAIREFQIYKGSLPAKYGGRTASVLDIKMTNPSTESFRISGGVGLISNRLTTEIPIVKDKLSVLLSGRFSYNNYLVKFYNKSLTGLFGSRRVPDNEAGFYDLADKIYFRPNQRNVISFSNYFSNDDFTVDGLFGVRNIVADRSRFNYGHQSYALRWSYFFNPDLALNTVAVSTRYLTRAAVLDSFNRATLKTNFLYRQVKTEIVHAPADKKFRSSGGLSAIRYDILPGDIRPDDNLSGVAPATLGKEQSWETAAYAIGEYEPNKTLLVEIGLRYAYYRNIGPLRQAVYASDAPRSEKTILDTLVYGKNEAESSYGGLEPRVAVRLKLGPNASLKAGYNRSRQFIQLLSNNATPLPTARWKTSNSIIKPQVSDFASMGLFYDTPKGFWEYAVEGYYRKSDQILDFVNSANLQFNPYVETQLIAGKGRSYGVELMATKKKGKTTGWINYTYSRSLQQIKGDFPEKQQINNGDWFPSYVDKPHTFNCLLNIRGDEHNSVSFTFTYSTGRPYTVPVGVFLDRNSYVPIYLNRNNGRISDYHRLDFSWTISNPRMKKQRYQTEWVFAVYNLYGRKNAYSYFFKPVSSGVEPVKLSIFAYPLPSLSYNFKFQ